MSVGGVVMAHERRRDWAVELATDLGIDVVWDRVNDRHETGLRCLQAGVDSGVSHWMIVQDDAIVCRDLLAGVDMATTYAGERVVGLYVGNVRPLPVHVDRSVALAKRMRSSWLAMPGPWWGVGLVIPTSFLPDLIADYRASQVQNYDRRIERWVARTKSECWYTMPSLVEHRSGGENPSLVANRPSTNRRARWFIGREASALAVDWKRPPSQLADHSVWRNKVTGRVLRVRPGSAQAVRLEISGVWEPIPEDDPAAATAQYRGRASHAPA